jgi:hypothetical protein
MALAFYQGGKTYSTGTIGLTTEAGALLGAVGLAADWRSLPVLPRRGHLVLPTLRLFLIEDHRG